jgi:transcriptional regulator with XRE-family HTH domain
MSTIQYGRLMQEEAGTVELGRALQVRRAQLGMKRRELADRALLSYPYVSEIENGAKTPSAKALRQLADALRLTPADLMARADQPSAIDDVSPEAIPLARLEQGRQPVYAPPAFDRAPRVPDATANAVSARIRTSDHPHDSQPSVLASGAAMPEGMLERWIRELVGRIVREELAAWQAAELPELMRAECRRALDEQDPGRRP